MKLGLLVNFRDQYLKPKCIIRIDTEKIINSSYYYALIRIISMNSYIYSVIPGTRNYLTGLASGKLFIQQ